MTHMILTINPLTCISDPLMNDHFNLHVQYNTYKWNIPH